MIIPKDLTAAAASPMTLAILEEGDSYGYAIIKRVRELSGGEMEWTDGMLYPVLHRLEDQGFIQSYWGSGATARKRRYYRITEDGRRELAALRHQWQTVNASLNRLWGESPGGNEHV